MGSEQSNLSNQSTTAAKGGMVRRQHTIANPDGCAINEETNNSVPLSPRPGSISPGPSVCSDTDLPYISYTVNRPIGDSPKLANKQLLNKPKRKLISKSTSVSGTTSSKACHKIVVVKAAPLANSAALTTNDPEIQRLNQIPQFLPIMRATLNLPAAPRDPEILERLDSKPLQTLCLKYQMHLTQNANVIAMEQNALTQKVREIDGELNRTVQTVAEKQKKYARYCEKFAKVKEISQQLNKCHFLLNQCLESIECLNDYLDVEERLEPFVWTTG